MTTINLSQTNTPKNMGTTDRWVRGSLGALMLLRTIFGKPTTPMAWLNRLIGGAFLFYGVTGFDPLLKVLNTNSHAKDKNNVVNKLRTAAQQRQQRTQESPLTAV